MSETELIDEDDILGMTIGITAESQNEVKRGNHGTMDPENEQRNEASEMVTDEDTKQNTKINESENEDNRGSEGRNLRARSKKDYKSIASGKVTPTPNEARTHGETSTKTPTAQKQGEKAPKEKNQGEKAPKDKKAKKKKQDEKAPKEKPDENASKEKPDENASKEKHGEKAPKEYRDTTPQREHKESPEREHQDRNTLCATQRQERPNQEGNNPENTRTNQPGTSWEKHKAIEIEDNSSTNNSDSSSNESEDKSWKHECSILRRKTQELTRKLEEEHKENKTNKRKIKRKIEELEEAVEEIRRLEERLEDAKQSISNLEMEKRELEGEAKRRKAEQTQRLNQLTDRNIDLEERVKHLMEEKEKDQATTEELKKKKRETQDRLEEVKRRLTSTEKKLKKTEEMNDELIQRITKDHPKPDTHRKETHKETRKEMPRALLIGDSNSKRIMPHLEDSLNWSITENTYRIEDVKRVDTKGFEVCVTMLGTNNIKNGNDGMAEARRLLKELKNIKTKKILICEAPPINRRNATVERRLYNATLRNESKNTPGLETIRTPPETEECNVEEALTDDLHLNEYHARLMAKKISDRAKAACERKTDKEAEPEQEMIIEAEEEEIKTVMGNQHSRAMEIEKNYNVKIKANRRDPNRIHITGKKENVKKAHEDIKSKIRDHKERRNRNEERKEERRNIPCIFFAQKRCIKGDRCFFSHDRRSRSKERRRERSPEHRDRRSRSRSPAKDTRVIRIRSIHE